MSQQGILDALPYEGEGEPMSFAAIRKAMGTTGNGHYGMKTLLHTGEVKMVIHRGRRTYIKAKDPKLGSYVPPSYRDLKFACEETFEEVQKSPGITVSGLGRKLKRAKNTISRRVRLLEESNRVEIKTPPGRTDWLIYPKTMTDNSDPRRL